MLRSGPTTLKSNSTAGKKMFDYQGSRGEFLQVLADVGEEPAFIQRARAANDASDELFRRCQVDWDEMLRWPRSHLKTLADRVHPDWSRLSRYLANEEGAEVLRSLYRQWESRMSPSFHWAWTNRQALTAFLESAQRFNAAWSHYLGRLDLRRINQLRSSYNQYYPIEKACALGSEHAARNFTRLGPITVEQLRSEFPLLELPELK